MEQKLKNKSKNINGITLVALSITIIVLLILVGVSIGLVFNNEGLFEKTNSVASKYNEAKQLESEFLKQTDEKVIKYGGIILPMQGTEPPEEGWSIAEAKGLVARDGLKAHLGEKVKYTPKAGGTWRILYYDNEDDGNGNGYFGKLNTLYLKRDYVLNDTELSNYKTYTPTDGGEIMKKVNPKWAAAVNSNELDLENEHCVSWLCDPSVWEEDYKVEGLVDYAIGAPSVEMYMKAFNVYKDNNANSTALINKIGNSSGYSVGAQNSYTWNDSREFCTGNNSLETGPNNLFMTEGNHDWWLASPSSRGRDLIIYVRGEYAYLDGRYTTIKNGICPVVSII